MGEVKVLRTVDPYGLKPEEVPPMLLLHHYIREPERFRHAAVFQGRFAWDPLKAIGPYLEQLEPQVPSRAREAVAAAQPVSLRNGELQGRIVVEEGAEIEPFVLLRAVEGAIYIGPRARIRAFTRIEAKGGDLYLLEETVIGMGCDIEGFGAIGCGSTLVDTTLRGKVLIGEETKLTKAVVLGPSCVGNHCELRPGAFLRENSLLGDFVEFRSESKNSILLDGLRERGNDTAAAHYSYIGDSIIGRGVNFGAGTKTSNLKVDRSPVSVVVEGVRYPTGLRKFGAVVGDLTQTGCLAVFDPGALVGPETLVYPGAALRGYYPPRSIVKVRQVQEIVERR